MENAVGIVAGILTSGAMIPQLVKVLKEKNVEDLSANMLIVLIIGLSLWVWYGIMKDEWPIIVSNSFAVLVNISLAICLVIYRK
jgi:MtN3 and saliva related transmembrane protein